MRGSGWGILHHWAVGKLNSMGSWCTKLSNYMGGWYPRKLSSMGGWVKKRYRLPPPGICFWNSPHGTTQWMLSIFESFLIKVPAEVKKLWDKWALTRENLSSGVCKQHVKLCIMLSHAPKGHNLILMISCI